MIFVDCMNLSINKIKQLEKKLLESNLSDDIIINCNEKYNTDKLKTVNIKDTKEYIKYLKKANVVFLCDRKDDINIFKYSKYIFIISDFYKGVVDGYHTVGLDNLPKLINKYKLKNQKAKTNRKRRNIALILIIVITFITAMIIIFNNKKEKSNEIKEKKIVKKEKKDYRNENYAFVGDSITYYYDTKKYFEGIPTVNTGVCGYQTDDIYNNLNEYAYIYNPTKIFLLIGTNDLIHKDNDYIVNKIIDIIVDMKKNRPSAEIYLESIYPVNDTDDEKIDHNMVNKRSNDRIKEINKELKKICDTGNCKYIDMYDILKDENDNLKLEYTEEGLHISEEGYEVITKKLKEILKNE